MKVRKCLSCSGDDGLWRSICVTIPGTVIRVGSGLYQIPPTSSALTVPHFPLLSNFPHSMCSPIPIVSHCSHLCSALLLQFLSLSNSCCSQMILLFNSCCSRNCPIPIQKKKVLSKFLWLYTVTHQFLLIPDVPRFLLSNS